MICRYCGTDIADKALICYKCGNATTEARIVPPSRSHKKRRQVTVVVVVAIIVLLLLLAWRLGFVR
jgi:hypothetical protein